MGQLMGGASGGGWQPMAQSWAPLADPRETGEAYLAEAELPGVARDDISAGGGPGEVGLGGQRHLPWRSLADREYAAKLDAIGRHTMRPRHSRPGRLNPPQARDRAG